MLINRTVVAVLDRLANAEVPETASEIARHHSVAVLATTASRTLKALEHNEGMTLPDGTPRRLAVRVGFGPRNAATWTITDHGRAVLDSNRDLLT